MGLFKRSKSTGTTGIYRAAEVYTTPLSPEAELALEEYLAELSVADKASSEASRIERIERFKKIGIVRSSMFNVDIEVPQQSEVVTTEGYSLAHQNNLTESYLPQDGKGIDKPQGL